MKKFLIILGTIFLIIIVLSGIGLAIFVVVGSALDKQSKAYADANLPIIISTWDEQALLDRASPEFMQVTTKEELDRYFLAMTLKLGRMHSCEGCVGESFVKYSVFSNHNGRTITAKYTAKTTFDRGSAKITLLLIKHGDKWQIESFHVSSAALALY